MAKKRGPKPTVNISSSEDTKFAKLSNKERGKNIGGDPDQWDVDNIQQFLDIYEAAHPGHIRRMMEDVKVEIALSGINKYAEVSKDSGMRKAFWLPDNFAAILEVGYPSIWTNPKHTRWFIRHFPQFAYETYTKAVKTK